jgi:peptidoglycan/xylan/chitin deacetylase (PgdA/CDA1 family)
VIIPAVGKRGILSLLCAAGVLTGVVLIAGGVYGAPRGAEPLSYGRPIARSAGASVPNSAPAQAGSAPVPGAARPGTLPRVVDNGPRTGKKVALTFDADMTTAMKAQLASGAVRSYANLPIIDLLERQNIPATFFLTGMWVEQYPDLTGRLAANPRFELANHSYGHQGFTPNCYSLGRVPSNLQTEDVAKTFRIVEKHGGRQTRYFRFPGLCHDGASLSALAPLGLTVVDGDVVSGDPFATAYQPIVRAVLSTVRAGSVVIMHVTEANAQYTDEALPLILAGLAEKGLVPATLSEVLGPPPAEPGRCLRTGVLTVDRGAYRRA